MNRWFVYMLKCADDTYYIGITTDLKDRVAAHNRGKNGAKYTRSRRPVRLCYSISVPTKSEALRREIAMKKLSRQEKVKWDNS